VTLAYARVRLIVLEGVLGTTPDGYRANDARVLIGAIHWRTFDEGAALDAWCAIAPHPADEYVEAVGDFVKLLRVPAGADICTTRRLSREDKIAIDRLLQRERWRLWDFQYRRLKTFGYALDMF
jgi:hypothetical protein